MQHQLYMARVYNRSCPTQYRFRRCILLSVIIIISIAARIKLIRLKFWLKTLISKRATTT